MLDKQMLIKLCGVQIYRGNFSPISVSVVDGLGEEHSLFDFNPDAVRIQGEELVLLIEELTRKGALRIHPSSVQEF